MHTLLNISAKDLEFLRKEGFTKVGPTSPYEVVRYTGPCTVILYTTGKCVVTGNGAASQKVVGMLSGEGGEVVPPMDLLAEKGWVIGSDEALKGDTFGGLVVAAVKADDAGRAQLREMDVRDSKTLSDLEVHARADRIKKTVKYCIKAVDASEYNKHSQTALMNQLHQQAAAELKPGTHVVDEYPGCTVGDVRETQAESKFLEVAAASILARDEALKQLERLGKELGFVVPKGSTHVSGALAQLKVSKKDPSRYVKMHFKNVQLALTPKVGEKGPEIPAGTVCKSCETPDDLAPFVTPTRDGKGTLKWYLCKRCLRKMS